MEEQTAPMGTNGIHTELRLLADLKPHPKNYNKHPEDEIEQLVASIKEHGLYRPVVVANDDTILAGHGVSEALMKIGYEYVSVYPKDYGPDDPRALRLLVGDNEIGRLAERDDRLCAENLKELREQNENGLLGTGFDELKLANLVFVTRPASEIGDRDAAAHWAGMPEYDDASPRLKVTVFFPSEEDKTEFGRLLGVDMTKVESEGLRSTMWWPRRVINDLKSVVFSDREESERPALSIVDSPGPGGIYSPSDNCKPGRLDVE